MMKKSESSEPTFRRGPNKSDRNGNPLRCGICESTFHFKRDCPHNNAPTMLQSAFCDEQMSILNVDDDYDSLKRVDETSNRALIDTGATVTVCGDQWMNNYLESLCKEDRSEVTEEKRRMVFRFGDGRGIRSTKYSNIHHLVLLLLLRLLVLQHLL